MTQNLNPDRALFVGGCADGKVETLNYRLPTVMQRQPLSAVEAVKRPLTPPGVMQKYDVEEYYRHELHIEDGGTFPLYIVKGMDPSEAMDRILTVYANATGGQE